ncbi:MAG: restriction endonuclease subunit S [Treponema sp.]|nr:restriction endonuclease subunit S [Treponema sp.]
MKKDWEIKKLGEVCLVAAGQGAPQGENNYSNEGTPFVKAGNLVELLEGKSETEIQQVNETVAKKYKLKKYKSGSVLFAKSGMSCMKGYVYTLKNDSYVVSHLAVLTPFDCLSSFLNYYLQFVKTYSMVKDAAYPTISLEDINNLAIPIPPLEEQKRIVKILDEKFAQLESLKANAQTNLQNAKDLFQSQLAKSFVFPQGNTNTTWGKAKLEDIALDFSRGKSKHRPRNDKCLFGGDYPFIQTGDIRNADKYVTDYSETYNETGLAQSKLWPAGTLCITIAANIAETAILSFPCCFPDSVIGFIPNEKLTTVDFVYYLIQFFKSELQKLSKGAAQDNLNLAKFENMNFPLPPLSEQKRIVKELDTLSEKTKALQNIYEQMLLDCEELKQSLLAKAFEGNL